ncbi:hypothetical protein SAMN05216276_107131 [Streptosporangium subroseum]|uniref:DUF4352 domain-containing protein n=1 Tax=Streptosporangium subroseum TaxID=106412 RepID=A0A239NWW6_9ACTN|nr:hypothetical protein [Streptosporangium subroseum]SNT58953.1 hypothetical protein SAMN05216276_107131 [Streptosporangium subroseum]
MDTPLPGTPEDEQQRDWFTPQEKRPPAPLRRPRRFTRTSPQEPDGPSSMFPPSPDGLPPTMFPPPPPPAPRRPRRPAVPGAPAPSGAAAGPAGPAGLTPPDRRWEPRSQRVFGDEQVWPPRASRPEEEAGISTQPFPAVTGAPLPRRADPEAPPAVPEPAPADPAPAPAVPAPAFTVPEPPRVFPAPPLAAPVEEPAPAATAVPRRRGRTALRVGVAAVTVVLAGAFPAWNNYDVYKVRNPDDRIYTVAPGGSATLMQVSWKAAIEPADGTPGLRPLPADRQWLKIKLTRTYLDAEGAVKRGTPEVDFRDAEGRSWQTAITRDDLPEEPAEQRIGTGYHYELIGVVPKALASKVEVYVRPNLVDVIPDQPVEDIFKPSEEDPVPTDQVLRFKR